MTTPADILFIASAGAYNVADTISDAAYAAVGDINVEFVAQFGDDLSAAVNAALYHIVDVVEYIGHETADKLELPAGVSYRQDRT